MGLLPSKKQIGLWFVARWYKQALQGKKGKDTMKFVQKIQGLRTAIMALILALEVVANGLGFQTGPLFGLINGAFSAVGWNPNGVQEALGVDPKAVGMAALTLYFAVKRLIAWKKEKAEAEASKDSK